MGILFNTLTKADFFSVKFSGDPIQEEQFNIAINDWANETKSILIRNVENETSKGKSGTIFKKGDILEKKLSKSIGFHLNRDKNSDVISRVRFAFERHGVYLQKGVGRGTRNPVNWFNDSIESQIEKLGDLALDNAVQFNIDGWGIKIK